MLHPLAVAFDDLLNFFGQCLAIFYRVIPSYGLSIILLTVATRLVVLPLTVKQTRSMQAVQRLQPEVKKLQAKYKGDRQKLNEEMMRLYKEEGVNPLGGCLPLLLQLPVFFALYRVFEGCGKLAGKKCVAGYVGVKYLPHGSALAKAIEAGRAGFLGMNLGISPVDTLHKGLLTAFPSYLLILLMVFTTWYQQKQIMSTSPAGSQNQQMQLMGKIMPLMLGIFSLELPAGVSIYWVASNIWQIVQQSIVLGVPLLSLASPAAAGAGGSGDAGKGGSAGKEKQIGNGKAPPGKKGEATVAKAKDAPASGKGTSNGVPAGKGQAKPPEARPPGKQAGKAGAASGKGPAKVAPKPAPAGKGGDASAGKPAGGEKPATATSGTARPRNGDAPEPASVEDLSPTVVPASLDGEDVVADGVAEGAETSATAASGKDSGKDSNGSGSTAEPAETGAGQSPAARPRPQRAASTNDPRKRPRR